MAACAGDRMNRSAGEAVDDSALATKVKSALIADPVVKGTQVEVEVFKGVVQLSGFVDSTANAQKAVNIARNVQGVKEVRNSMIVK
jgi:osmotically-inducible protein OsmY